MTDTIDDFHKTRLRINRDFDLSAFGLGGTHLCVYCCQRNEDNVAV